VGAIDELRKCREIARYRAELFAKTKHFGDERVEIARVEAYSVAISLLQKEEHSAADEV